MVNMIFLTAIFGVILAILLFSGVVKTTKFTFGKDPTGNIYQSEEARQTQSERTADLAERNRQMMDRVKAQMERNRR